MTNLYRHPYHGHLRAADTAPADYVEVSLAALGTSPSTVAPLYRTLETTTPTVWHPQRYYSGAPEQEGFQDGYSNAIIYAYKRSATIPTDDPGDITYSFATASITTATLANGWQKSIGDTVGDFNLYVISIPAASQDVTANYLAADWGVPTLLAQSATDSITVLLSNPTHAIPTDNAGNNGNYTGSGTEVRVYEGSTELAYNGVGTTAGTWNATLVGTGITPGSKTDSGNYLTVGAHSAITSDVANVAITVTGKRIDGTSFTIPAVLQSLSKSKAGADGVGGPTVSITSSRPTTFTYTDGVYDSGQSNITLTGTVNNLASPTLAWTFQGFEVNPVDSGTTTQVITSTQLGVMRSAKVTLTANGLYVDTITIVRLDKSTAVAGATRNVFRGTWLTATSYAVGDIVLDANGYGWSCLTAHVSGAGATTPVYPVTSNVNWTIYTVKGDSSTSGFLTNEVHTVPTASDGTGASYTSAGGTFKVSYGTLDVTTSSTFAITGGTDGGTTWSKTQNGLTLTLNETTGVYTLSGAAWTSDSEAFTLTATYASTVISKVYTISKAKAGAGGAAGTPAQYVTISGEQVFKFLTGAVVPTATSITLTAALFGGLTLYSWQYWNGSSWVNLSGTQNTSSYALAYNNAAWSGSSLRVRCLSGSVWDEYTIVKLYDGATGPQGNAGTRTAILDMYLWSGTTPVSFPSGTSTYTWATGQFTVPATSNGWNLVPGIPSAGQTLYLCRQVFSDNLTTATSSVTWTANTSMTTSKAGTDGSAGTNGQRTGVLEVYKWSTTTPTTYPSGTSTYTWATGSFTTPSTANGWSLVPGSGSMGQTLWAISVIVSDNLTTATSIATWNSTTVYPVGYFGINGSDGATGATGQSARRAYIVTTNPAPPAPEYCTANTGDLPPAVYPPDTVAFKPWNFNAYNDLIAGQFQYVMDGIYTPGGNIAWGNPYLNYLKVGTLEALATNTGSLTVSDKLTTGNPVRSGTTMTSGKGILQESSGAFIMGTPSTNIAFDGTNPIKVNGEIILAANIAAGSVWKTEYLQLNAYDFTGINTADNAVTSYSNVLSGNLQTIDKYTTRILFIDVELIISDNTPGKIDMFLLVNGSAVTAREIMIGNTALIGGIRSFSTMLPFSLNVAANAVTTIGLSFDLTNAVTNKWNNTNPPVISATIISITGAR